MLGIRRHHRSRRLHDWLYAGLGSSSLECRRFDLRGPYFHGARMRLLCRMLRESMLNVAQYGEARLRVVEHVPGLGAPGLDRFHVVLDADDRVGEAIRIALTKVLRPAGLEHHDDKRADAVDDVHRARLVEHQQPGFDAADQRRDAVEALRRGI